MKLESPLTASKKITFDVPSVERVDAATKRQLVSSVPFWWGSINLGDGVVTPGHKPKSKMDAAISQAIPADLRGKRVLDVGAWDGYYSFECEERGADVFAIDSGQHESVTMRHAGFRAARRARGSRVRFAEASIFQASELDAAPFDVVLLLGVIYHTPSPIVALKRAADLTRDWLIVETHLGKSKGSTIEFYAGSEQNDDPTNWTGPSEKAVLAMLDVLGFSIGHARNLGGRLIVSARKTGPMKKPWPAGL